MKSIKFYYFIELLIYQFLISITLYQGILNINKYLFSSVMFFVAAFYLLIRAAFILCSKECYVVEKNNW